MTHFNGINVVSISVSDLDEARRFYGTVLGLGEPAYDLAEYGWIEFETGGPGNLSLTATEEGWESSTGTTIVLNTAD